jgi:hypothetical protein
LSKIQLIPTLEIPHPAEAWEMGGQRPAETWHCRPNEWEKYLVQVNAHSGYGKLQSFPVGSGRYPLPKLSQNDIARVIELHVADTPVKESCALFGGYVLIDNGVPILLPQCCGTLADISSWEAITREDAFSEYFCLEGHPCPEAISDGTNIEIHCVDEWEPFEEPAPKTYTLNRAALSSALKCTRSLLQQFARQLDEWGDINGNSNVSDILIYGSE